MLQSISRWKIVRVRLDGTTEEFYVTASNIHEAQEIARSVQINIKAKHGVIQEHVYQLDKYNAPVPVQSSCDEVTYIR